MKQIYRSTRAVLTLLFLSFCALGGMNAQTWVETPFASLQSGDVIVIADKTTSLAMPNDGGTGSSPAATDITVASGMITSNVPDKLKWVFEPLANGQYSFRKYDSENLYLYCTATNTGVRVGTNPNKEFEFDASTNKLKHVALSRWLGVYNSQDWRCYTSPQTNIGNTVTVFYKLQASSLQTPDFAFVGEIPSSIQLKDGQASVSMQAVSTNSQGEVTYSVKGSPSGASIDTNGLFVATVAGAYTIVAQLAADEANEYAAVTIEHEISVLPESVAGVGFSFIETFDGCDGTTGEFSGSAGSRTFKPEMADNEGWVFSSVYAADKAVKLGTGNLKGSATTPTLAFTGDAVLTFTAAAWNNSSEKTTLNISISDGTLSQSSVTLEKAKYNTYTINITGVTQPVTITIEANVASYNRFFLDYVSVVQESAAGETLRDGLAAGKFGTICVNRTIEVSETEGATFYTVAGAHFNGSNPDYIVLEEAETLEAGRGYIFEATAEAITTTNAEAATATEGTNDGVIYGSLVDCKVPVNCYVISDNVLRKSGGESTIKAGRAYIDLTNVAHLTDAEAAAPSYRRLGFDGTLTGIAAVGQATDEAAVYDLSGRLVRKAAKGVYVVNGKKVLVK